MARVSPLRRLHQLAEAAMLPYAPADAPPEQVVEVVASYGEPELEYAAIRRGCILLDLPHRAVLELTGPDRVDFLNRMVTQELRGFAPGQVRRSFWLNRKGRIDADLRLVELGDRTLAELDIHAAPRALAGLSAFIITEEVAIRDRTEELHRLALHGPTSLDLLAAVTAPAGDTGPRDLAPDRAIRLTYSGVELTALRDDLTGEPGVELIIPAEIAEALFQRLIEVGAQHDHDPSDAAARYRLRPAGWHALNVARIEAGRPLYNIDFGPDSLPAETGVISDRVSFTKGCYLGQEIVARMHARGHPKKQLVALRLQAPADPAADPAASEAGQPGTGAPVFMPSDGPSDPIGAITSSAVSPMLGSAVIAFAQVKYEHASPGTGLLVDADGITVPATIQNGLRFWSRA